MTGLSEWLEERGLDVELADKMGWRERTDRGGQRVVAIPYLRNGETVNVQYRRLDAKEFRFKEGCQVELWNCDCLRDHTLDDRALIIAEGACDGLAVMQAGESKVVAVPGWSSFNCSGRNYEPFKRWEADIRRSPRLIVARHDDDAGSALLQAIASFFDGMDVRFAVWPTGSKDANDTLLAHGEMVLKDALMHAKPVDPPGMLIADPDDLAPRPYGRVWKVEEPELDNRIAFTSGDLSVLTGKPAAGKTTFALWMAYRLVRAHGVRIGMCLFEKAPNLITWHLRTLGLSNEERRQHFRFVHRLDDPTEPNDMGWLKRAVHTLAAREGCDLIFVDPWNELDHLLERGETMTNYINVALKSLRQWAAQYGCHICLVAHPRKRPYDKSDIAPTGDDIADSAAFNNKAAMGWTLHLKADEHDNETVELYTWKVRDRQLTGCRPGKVELLFDEKTLKYRAKAWG